MKISFKIPVDLDKRPQISEALKGEVEFPLSNDVQENINQFGADVVNSYFLRGAVVAVQSLRAHLVNGTGKETVASNITPEKLQTLADNLKLGVRQPRSHKDPVDTASKAIDQMTEEQLLAAAQLIKARRSAIK